MSGMAPTLTALGSVMSKLVPIVCRIDTFQLTEPFRTFFILPRQAGVVAVSPALTGCMVQPPQPCTRRVSDVVRTPARAAAAEGSPADETANAAAHATLNATAKMRTACRYMWRFSVPRDQVCWTLTTSAPTGWPTASPALDVAALHRRTSVDRAPRTYGSQHHHMTPSLRKRRSGTPLATSPPGPGSSGREGP